MNSHIRTLLLCTLAIASIMLGACADDVVAPQAESFAAGMEVAELASTENGDFRSWTGVIGGSNQYEILVPSGWNGELVLYAHGFVDSAEPLALPQKDNIAEIRDRFVDMGFAFAYCSFRENGLAVKDGAWSTRRVLKIFHSKVKEKPVYTWLMGHSLGALVAVDLAESQPSEYDGVVALAGMIGGSKAEIDYMGDVRVIFDLFYPGALPGSVVEPMNIVDPYSELIVPVVTAVTLNPDGLGIMSRILPLPGRNPDELVESLITALMFNNRALPDVLERTGGACPYDNADRVYAERWPGALPPGVIEMVNAAVQRYERSIPTDNLFERYYEPNGRLAVEMMTLHLEHDPIVPVFHEARYAQKVAATGASGLLEQRVVAGYGHTLELPMDDVMAAFTDLRGKVVPMGTPLVSAQ